MRNENGNALVGIIIIILILLVGGVYFWNQQLKHAAEIKAKNDLLSKVDLWSDDAGETSVIESNTDVRSLNDQIDQTSFDGMGE